MNLGDQVISKKTGLPASGEVIGIVEASLYQARMGGSQFTRWDELYPDWADKPIVFVKMSEAQKPFTLEEYHWSIQRTNPSLSNIPYDDLRILYHYMVPKANIIAYPIDDLEIVE